MELQRQILSESQVNIFQSRFQYVIIIFNFSNNLVRPEQKIWQKMFIKDIPEECVSDLMIRLLRQFGEIKNFKRLSDNRGKLTTFCQFDLQTGQQIMRIKRLFYDIKILDKHLQLKISAQTQNFIKQWLSMQKDEWRKKLLTPSMNQAKQYETIDHFHKREDSKYRENIQETIRSINIQVKKVAVEKMREQERKEHPREKEREKRKRQILDDLQKKFHTKQDYWIKKEKQMVQTIQKQERQHRKEKDKEKERLKGKMKKFEREIELQQQQQSHRISKYRQTQRRKTVQREQQQDIDKMQEEFPPQPQQHPKRSRFTVRQELIIGEGKHEQIIVQVSEMSECEAKQQGKRSQFFNEWQKEGNLVQQQQPKLDLKLPEIIEKEENENIKQKLVQISGKVPQNKLDLWEFPIEWELLSKSVIIEKKIRPWLQKRSCEYIGCVEEKFITLVEKKLLSKSHPDKIIKILKQVIEEDAEEFVIKLWKTLVFQSLKLKAGIN